MARLTLDEIKNNLGTHEVVSEEVYDDLNAKEEADLTLEDRLAIAAYNKANAIGDDVEQNYEAALNALAAKKFNAQPKEPKAEQGMFGRVGTFFSSFGTKAKSAFAAVPVLGKFASSGDDKEATAADQGATRPAWQQSIIKWAPLAIAGVALVYNREKVAEYLPKAVKNLPGDAVSFVGKLAEKIPGVSNLMGRG